MFRSLGEVFYGNVILLGNGYLMLEWFRMGR